MQWRSVIGDWGAWKEAFYRGAMILRLNLAFMAFEEWHWRI